MLSTEDAQGDGEEEEDAKEVRPDVRRLVVHLENGAQAVGDGGTKRPVPVDDPTGARPTGQTGAVHQPGR